MLVSLLVVWCVRPLVVVGAACLRVGVWSDALLGPGRTGPCSSRVEGWVCVFLVTGFRPACVLLGCVWVVVLVVV